MCGANSLVDDRKVYLFDVLRVPGDRLRYMYDFGDRWQHVITLKEIRPCAENKPVVQLLAGRNASPPEDYGGCHKLAEALFVIRYSPRRVNRLTCQRTIEKSQNITGRYKPGKFSVRDTQKKLLRTYESRVSKANDDNMFTHDMRTGFVGSKRRARKNRKTNEAFQSLDDNEEMLRKTESRVCDYCDAKSVNMKPCSGCLNVFYCKRKCQKRGWKKHKFYCIRLNKQTQHEV